LTIKLQVAWNVQYENINSPVFIRLKTLVERVFTQIIRQSRSVIVQRFFESSVGVVMDVNYNSVPSQAMIDEANQQMIAYLSANGWQIVDIDGTVYPVIATPILEIGNQSVSTTINPCLSFVCNNGGTCMSVLSSGVYMAPTCKCSSLYTGPSCNVSVTTNTSAAVDNAKLAIAIAVPVAAIIFVVIIVTVFCFIRQPIKRSLGYSSRNLIDDSNSPFHHDALGLEGNRSLRMNRFWPNRRAY